jgi:uncharacterized protein YecE (DUF72 family)
VEESVRFFCNMARLLEAKLGPLLFQLPPNFRKDAGRLADVLTLIPADLRAAFEFRHPTWFDDEVYGLLRAKNAALCIVDHEDGATPAVATADWGYFRLRAVEYSAEDLARWAKTNRDLFASGGAFVYFKHEDGATGPPLARRLIDLLA